MSILNFDSFCSQISLPICPLVGNQLEPTCYSRNVELGPDALMFQPGISFDLNYSWINLLSFFDSHIVDLRRRIDYDWNHDISHQI